ncbi:MAG: ABC transporter permease [Ewingella sp.]
MILPYLLILPVLGPILVFMSLVIGMAVSQSFGLYNFAGKDHLSLAYWQELSVNPQFWRALAYSARIATISALLAVTLAYPLALWLRKPFPGSALISGLLKAPLMIHGLVAALLFINIISWQGLLNLTLLKLGLIDHPLRMQNDSMGIGVVFLQVWKQMPFALLILSGAVRGISEDWLYAARDLGASWFARFHQILLPLTLRAVQVSLILIFIGAAGDFAFQVVAGPTSVNSLAQLMVRMQDSGDSGWNLAAVVAVVLMLLSLVGSLLMATLIQVIVNIGRSA